jgi:hypothetical protein
MKKITLILAVVSTFTCSGLRSEDPPKVQLEESKQPDLLAELKEAPDGVLRVKTNEDGSFKSLVVKATVEIEDALGGEKGKQYARKEAEIECKKHLAQWLNENCEFVEASNKTVSFQTKGESTKDAAGNTVKVRSQQGQESKVLTESHASLAEASLKGLEKVSETVEDTEFVTIMALKQSAIAQSAAVRSALTSHPATGSPKSSSDNDQPAPESKVNRDILKDLK